ncbi:MAG TPA: hypothetical protein P5150_03805 [Candidatus Ratteibacteria bacterium]|nr:hypothetical protein [bacterium]HRR95842.1 hypothetical protein [Candidatus Ratteibacteria bacterium]
MIKINIDIALTFYLMLPIIILTFWIFFEKRANKPFEIKSHDYLWQCPICFYMYIDSKSDKISRCPRCKTLHKKGEKL